MEAQQVQPYIDVQWLEVYTRHPSVDGKIGLHNGNVMDYFATSPFYDKKCENHTLKMNGLSSELLLDMTGIQFILDEQLSNEPELFVIRKVKRIDRFNFSTIQVYFCFQGTIFQGTSSYDIATTRLSKIGYYLNHSFESMLHIHKKKNFNKLDNHDIKDSSVRQFPNLDNIYNHLYSFKF